MVSHRATLQQKVSDNAAPNRNEFTLDHRILPFERASDSSQLEAGSSTSVLKRSVTSALLAQDKDLERILREVDGIAKAFVESNSPDASGFSAALRRAVSRAVKQSTLERELRSLALTDDLTSLYNRRAFYALATQELKVMRRRGRDLLLIFADVDHLKAINDTFGHREGDLALVRTARALERTFRDSDIVARLSGDEFAILALEATSGDQAAILRRLKEQLSLVSAEENRYKLSLSVGMVRFDPKHATVLGDLLSEADQAMYAEKKAHLKPWTCRQ
jgi:diguanylate cyclase (GGDEF)-like protein